MASDDFLASHVLRISETPLPGSGNVRDSKGKAKQFDTVNGKTVVVKESFVYSNKGDPNILISGDCQSNGWQDFEISIRRSCSMTSFIIQIL